MPQRPKQTVGVGSLAKFLTHLVPYIKWACSSPMLACHDVDRHIQWCWPIPYQGPHVRKAH